MARKTFISYKYSEAQSLRDDILEALGDDAIYYRGETSASPDLTDSSTDNIKNNLKNMIFNTSVTIVIISPHMKESNWIDWEIEYSLKEYKRNSRASKTNGLVGVIQKVDGDYTWLRKKLQKNDGHSAVYHDTSELFEIINNNRFNQDPVEYYCEKCQTVDDKTGSYLTLVTEEVFLGNISEYVENAYNKSQKLWNYKLCKKR
ncbi:TIR domain-containing protein [Enterococcus casseliflavus]|uniref:TIR domain-containing protein n=1 Tax=Enterococcus casseliflavus TaxID=37734 RepID=UPI001E62F248|nr:TIR domain-containing protein [Enterococcus casseliflavus]MCD5161429.1 TIR domain-containing protein [Enterococcus casseliflavus]MCD5192641.1 TIR domain-containing protein [Enterococcus casseliflavus]